MFAQISFSALIQAYRRNYASLVQREVARQRRGGGIVKSYSLHKTIPHPLTRELPLHKGAVVCAVLGIVRRLKHSTILSLLLWEKVPTIGRRMRSSKRRVTFAPIRKTPDEGFPLDSHVSQFTFPAFLNAWGHFALCGERPKALPLETASL